jgi:hypothetical protein
LTTVDNHYSLFIAGTPTSDRIEHPQFKPETSIPAAIETGDLQYRSDLITNLKILSKDIGRKKQVQCAFFSVRRTCTLTKRRAYRKPQK